MKKQLHNKILICGMARKLFLLFAILNVSIVAAQTFTENGVNYTVIPSTTNVEVVQKSPAYTGEITIPLSVIYNSVTYAVTSIGPQAFFYCTNLTSVAIPASVTSIEYSAFSNCTSLTSLSIPNSVTSIGQAAFSYCTSLTSLTIPNSVTSLGPAAFSNCNGLTDVTISNSITSIEEAAFSGCNSLTTITIPDSVISIGNFAFADCLDLTNVTFPNSVTSIGIFAFQFCSGLVSITIPNSVTSIGDYAFTNCSNLTTINCDIVTPLVINANVFGNVNQASCALNVPAGSVGMYQAAAVWKDFNPINGALSNESFVNKNKIKLYPNPVSDNLTIENPFIGNLQLIVISQLGQQVLKQNQNTSITSLDVSTLSKGLYFLNITSENGNSQTLKFIKN